MKNFKHPGRQAASVIFHVCRRVGFRQNFVLEYIGASRMNLMLWKRGQAQPNEAQRRKLGAFLDAAIRFVEVELKKA